ncbi:hypothetical protein L208DRAFT_1418806 [Tricholoma matsutake]|nr:hypothetical protein L208DRAFT_1418806 [Tricholoma matsutake 945]
MKLWSLIALSVAAVLFQVEAFDNGTDLVNRVNMNYYEDQNCQGNYMGTWPNEGPFEGECLGYYVAGAGSFNIADCKPGTLSRCVCIFFAQASCKGLSAAVVYFQSSAGRLSGDCANTATTIEEPRSVKCWVE